MCIANKAGRVCVIIAVSYLLLRLLACCCAARCFLAQILQHQQLVMEVVQQLSRSFRPDFKLIKKRIEDLIQREYLERDSENPQMFKYLA